MSQSGFEFLRKFIVHEIAMITFEYAQAFFKQYEKEGGHVIPGPVPRISKCVKWALMWTIKTGTMALLEPLLILLKPVYGKLVPLSPLMVLVIKLNRRLYAS